MGGSGGGGGAGAGGGGGEAGEGRRGARRLSSLGPRPAPPWLPVAPAPTAPARPLVSRRPRLSAPRRAPCGSRRTAVPVPPQQSPARTPCLPGVALTLQAPPWTPGPLPAHSLPAQVAGAAGPPQAPACFPQFLAAPPCLPGALPGPQALSSRPSHAPPRSPGIPRPRCSSKPLSSGPPRRFLPSQDLPRAPGPSPLSLPPHPRCPAGSPAPPRSAQVPTLPCLSSPPRGPFGLDSLPPGLPPARRPPAAPSDFPSPPLFPDPFPSRLAPPFPASPMDSP